MFSIVSFLASFTRSCRWKSFFYCRIWREPTGVSRNAASVRQCFAESRQAFGLNQDSSAHQLSFWRIWWFCFCTPGTALGTCNQIYKSPKVRLIRATAIVCRAVNKTVNIKPRTIIHNILKRKPSSYFAFVTKIRVDFEHFINIELIAAQDTRVDGNNANNLVVSHLKLLKSMK